MVTEHIVGLSGMESADDISTRKIPVPEWGGTFICQELSAEASGRLEALMAKANEDIMLAADFRIRYVAECWVDAKGNKIVRNEEGIKKLGKKNAKIIERIFLACREFNGESDTSLDDAEKNLENTPV